MASDIDVSKADAIPGYMDIGELRWLAERAREHDCIVELGSYLGRSTRALGDHARGTVYAVDNWQGPIGLGGVNFDPHEGQYEEFRQNLSDLIEAGKVIPVRSEHATAKVNAAPDMVFIDGSHDEASVRRDIRTWYEALQPGGLISGHDAMWPCLIETVWTELGFVSMDAATSIWWRRKC